MNYSKNNYFKSKIYSFLIKKLNINSSFSLNSQELLYIKPVFSNGLSCSIILNQKNKNIINENSGLKPLNIEKINEFDFIEIQVNNPFFYKSIDQIKTAPFIKEMNDSIIRVFSTEEFKEVLDSLSEQKTIFKNKKIEKEFEDFYDNFYINNDDEIAFSNSLNTEWAQREQYKILEYILLLDKDFDSAADFFIKFIQKSAEYNYNNIWPMLFENQATNLAIKLIKKEKIPISGNIYNSLKFNLSPKLQQYVKHSFFQDIEKILIMENSTKKQNNKPKIL